ncbi:EF-hand domain-containing family member C2 [Aplysia californica]|uniref:EF-hand domain-containing family member C2 n=1 Tax=Aplysia californica TaxID=6500 RepID=A0ABM0JLC2_APLCA|nr:EF-hand domain-containing family member C2 [Aplysia californica]
MALPFLPGNSFNKSLGKTKHHKSHHFDYANEVSMMVGAEKPGIGGEPLLGQKYKPRNTVFPKGEGSNLPAWVAFDRQVLSFDAYYQEAVHEKREEQYRVRNCKIYFYLEDDSIQVLEPRLKNAGVPQGTLIRRHRIPRPPPNEDEFYTAEDFNIGSEINLYSKVFKITECDQFTQNFMRKMGTNVQRPNVPPNDPYMNYRKAMDESMQPLRPYEKYDTLKQFLDHDRHVLRFFCYWDDTDNMFGDKREMVLHYYLADDTIEIREVIPPNAGRDAVPVFLRRGKLPKDPGSLQQPGVVTDRTVLNVFGPTGAGGRYILDSLKTGAINGECYTDKDLTPGAVISVWGRRFIICDCDDFTREYFKTKYGVDEMPTVSNKQDEVAQQNRQMPPYNGFGSEEDSLCSCKGLLPKPPKRDFIKFMERDRRGLDSNVLRFLARMDTKKPIDMDRRFIISYFLSDDTILVFEPPVRNSGIIGGKFLERSRVKIPNQERYSTELSEYYSAQDLFVGARVCFNNFAFILIDADEYAFQFMEDNSQAFVRSNINSVVQRLAAKLGSNKEDVRAFFAKTDPSGSGYIPYEKFREMVLNVEPTMSDQEIMTLARQYSDRRNDVVLDSGKLIAIMQEELRKRNFEGFGTLVSAFRHLDKACCGFLDRETIRKEFGAQHVPLPDDMLRAALSVAPTAESNNEAVKYEDFVRSLNWRDFPVPPVQYQPTGGADDWCGNKPSNQINNVHYEPLLQQIFGDVSSEPPVAP